MPHSPPFRKPLINHTVVPQKLFRRFQDFLHREQGQATLLAPRAAGMKALPAIESLVNRFGVWASQAPDSRIRGAKQPNNGAGDCRGHMYRPDIVAAKEATMRHLK